MQDQDQDQRPQDQDQDQDHRSQDQDQDQDHRSHELGLKKEQVLRSNSISSTKGDSFKLVTVSVPKQTLHCAICKQSVVLV